MFYAIGDIHGELNMLEALLDKLDYKHEDKLVFLGDYIDRGPDPKGVIDLLLALEKVHPRCIFLRGNHEMMFMNYLNGREQQMFIYNGGNTTVASYGAIGTFEPFEVPEAHMSFIRRTHRVYETANIIFVHAGISVPYDTLDDLPDEILLWARETSYKYTVAPKRCVFGHTPFKEVYQEGYMLGIDTGATFGGKLTCAVLGANGKLQKVVSVPSKDKPVADEPPPKIDDADLGLFL